MSQPISISLEAQNEIKETLIANKIPDTYGLRIGIKGGACSGSIVLGFDTKTENYDEYIIDTIKVYIDRRHFMYVLGAGVDFSAEAGGFIVQPAPKS